MSSFWTRGRDKLQNGLCFGFLLGAAIIWGNKLYSWLLIQVPPLWTQTIPLEVYILGICGLIGYFIDRF